MIKLKDLLKESKRLNLFEQAEELNLGPIGLAAIYGDNRVTIANNNWQTGAQQLVDQINNAVADDFTLNNLQVTVTGIASTAAASTAYLTTGPGNSTNVPNHNYQTVGTSTGGNLPQAWSVGGGTGVRVQNGNQFLATTRAQLMGRLLDQFLRSNLDPKAVEQLPQNYIVTRGIVQGNQPSMNVQITSKLTKQPVPIDKNLIAGAYVIDEGGTGDGLNTRRFTGTNWPSLAAEYKIWADDPSKAPADVLRRSNKQFGIYLTPKDNIVDLGLGPGNPVPLTKELVYELFKLKIPGRWQKSGWLNSYGGTWQDYAIEQYILAKAGKLTGTPEDIVAKYSAVINADGTAKGYPGLEIGQSGPKPTGIKWNTLNHLQKGVPGRERTGVPSDGQGRKLQ